MRLYSPYAVLFLAPLTSACSSSFEPSRIEYTCVSTTSETLSSDDSSLGLSPDEVVALIEQHFSSEITFNDRDGNELWTESSTVTVEMSGGATLDTIQTGDENGNLLDVDWGDYGPPCFEGTYGTFEINVTFSGDMVSTVDPMNGEVLWNGSTADEVWLRLEGYVEPNQHLLDEAQARIDHYAAKDVPESDAWTDCISEVPEDLDYYIGRGMWGDQPLSEPKLSIGSSIPCVTFMLAEQAE